MKSLLAVTVRGASEESCTVTPRKDEAKHLSGSAKKRPRIMEVEVVRRVFGAIIIEMPMLSCSSSSGGRFPRLSFLLGW